jgi:hypothetical protein
MKIDEVPQDGAYMIEGKIRDLCYAVDSEGNYTTTLSKGWAPKNEAIRLAWELVFEHAEATRQEVLEGKLSPIAFYMELNLMDTAILASYAGIPLRRVRKHLHMKGFNKLGPETISHYERVLKIQPGDLLNRDKIRDIVFRHED